MSDETVLEVNGLKKYFVQNQGLIDRIFHEQIEVKAINGVDFEISRGETLGLVGESGSGKSTVARCLVQLEDPTEGSVEYEGTDLTELSSGEMKKLRKEIQMVFQDPASSLNRRKTVAQTIKAPMEIHDLYEGERDQRVRELLETVGLSADYANRYPHEFSGGQRQRVGIARALAVDPEVLVLDEPVSALDVSIQAQILNLLEDLQEELGLTMLVISHDLSVINYICDRVAVMYLGELMEVAEAKELFRAPQHPYTRSLLNALPQPVPELARNRDTLGGTVPSPINPPSGCVFHTRCPEATEECSREDPPLVEIDNAPADHQAACIHVDEFDEDSLPVARDVSLYETYSVENFKKARRS